MTYETVARFAQQGGSHLLPADLSGRRLRLRLLAAQERTSSTHAARAAPRRGGPVMSEHREIDAHTGTETTGHEWDGIKELDTPLPRWWLWIFYGCIAFAVGYWILMPAWPGLHGYTPGPAAPFRPRPGGRGPRRRLKAQRGAQARSWPAPLWNRSRRTRRCRPMPWPWASRLRRQLRHLPRGRAGPAARAIPTCATTSGCGAARWRTSSAPSPTASGPDDPDTRASQMPGFGARRDCSSPIRSTI